MNNLLPNKTNRTRTPKHANLKFWILALLSVSTLLVVSAKAQTVEAQYSLIDLGVLPGKAESVPAALNNFGQVAGTSSAGSLVQSAFLFNSNSSNKEPIEDISRKDGSISRACGITDIGQVVGDTSSGPNGTRVPVTHAALFFNGTVLDLGFLKAGGPFSRANDINASAQVVGFSSSTRDGDNSRAFLWTASSGMIDIGTLGGAFAQAYAINDAGFVTGTAQTGGSTDREATHAFLSQPLSFGGAGVRGMKDLGTLGGNFSLGTSLNSTNHVVGYSTLHDNDQRMHAFLFINGGMKDLGSLGAKTFESDQSFALGINVSDQVVGYTFLPGNLTPFGSRPEPQQVAFLYQNGQMIDLNTLIGPWSSKYELLTATAINDKRQIVAVALSKSTGTIRAVLLTPSGK